MQKHKQVGEGFLLGQQSVDRFRFICGKCGGGIGRITDVDAHPLGFTFRAKCGHCGKETSRLKVEADWSEKMELKVQEIFKGHL